jgi:hypothetical protein
VVATSAAAVVVDAVADRVLPVVAVMVELHARKLSGMGMEGPRRLLRPFALGGAKYLAWIGGVRRVESAHGSCWFVACSRGVVPFIVDWCGEFESTGSD